MGLEYPLIKHRKTFACKAKKTMDTVKERLHVRIGRTLKVIKGEYQSNLFCHSRIEQQRIICRGVNLEKTTYRRVVT